MSIFPEKTIKEVLNKLAPVSVLKLINYRTDTMQEMKDSVKCFCPIHQEQVFRTLIINNKDKSYRCSYSLCPGNKGGDLISLYAKANKIDYDDALSKIVQELDLNIELPTSQEFIDKTVEVAENYLELGELEESESYFQKVIKAKPNHLNANLGLLSIANRRQSEKEITEYLKLVIEILFSERKFEDALAHIEEFLAKNPESLEFRRKLIDCYTELQMVEECYGEYMNLADLYEMNNDYDNAIDVYRKLEKLDIDIIDVYSHIINLLIAAERTSEAIDEAMKRVQIDKDSGNFENALEIIDPVLDLDKNRNDIKHLYIDLCLEAGKEPKYISKCLDVVNLLVRDDAVSEAVFALKRILSVVKEDTHVLSKLVDVYLKQGNENEAINTLIELSNIFLKKDDPDSAIASLDKLLGIQGEHLPALIRKSDIFISTRKNDEAKNILEKIISIYRRQNKYKDALPFFQKLTDLFPDNPELMNGQIELFIEAGETENAYQKTLKLVDTLINQNSKDQAAAKLKFALELKPDVTDVRVMLADLYIELGDFDEAKLEYFITAEEYKKDNKPTKAITQIKKIIEQDPLETDALEALGDIYSEIKDNIKAAQTYKELFQIYKDNGKTDKAESALKKILIIQPEDLPTLNELVSLYKESNDNKNLVQIYEKLIQLYNNKGAFGKVAEICNDIIKIEPENIQAHKALIKNAEATGKIANAIKIQFKLAEILEAASDTQGQIECYQYILEKKQDNTVAREKYIFLLQKTEKNNEAYSELDILIKQLLSNNKHEQIITIIKNLLLNDSENISLHQRLIETYKKAGKTDDVITQTLELISIYKNKSETKPVADLYKDLLGIDNSNVEFRKRLIENLLLLNNTKEAIQNYMLLAEQYIKEDVFEEAEKVYFEILKIDESDEVVHKALIDGYVNKKNFDKAAKQCMKLSDIQEGKGNSDQAIKTLRNIFIFDADNVEAFKKLIKIYKNENNIELTLESYQKIFDIYFKTKKYNEAVKIQKEAIEYQPEKPELRKTLIKVLLSNEQKDEAVTELFSLADFHRTKTQYDEAIDNLSEIISMDERNIKARKLKAEIFNKTGNVQAALEEFMALSSLYEQGGVPMVERAKPEEERVIEALPLCKEYKFDNFIIGSRNNFAHATALAVAKKPALAYNPLFLYSDVGLGKTHLMHAIANYIIEHHKTSRILYTNTEEFTTELVNAIQDNTITAFRDKHKNTDILLIDDVQFLSGKERAQEEFFHIFNTLFQAQKQIVLTSDRPPKDISHLEKRLISRFGAGVIVDIQPPDYETRIAILKQELEQYDFLHISDSLVNIIAEKMETNIRELKGALNQVIAVNQITGEEISEEMVKRVIGNLYEKV